MNPGLVVKLRPAGPWRIGPDSGARNRVDFIYHSDSLYSAVTSAMSRLGSLEEWLDATARHATPAVCFSSCFPFLDEIGFVVPPRTIWPPSSPASMSARVRWKSARFVPLGIVQSILAGQHLDESQWAVDGASECLVPAGRLGPFRTGVRWSAAVDRLTGAVERHSTACIEFRPGSGLWTIVSFRDDAAQQSWADRVKAAFRLLADSGFGGERSRGWGRAEAPEFIEGMLPEMILPPSVAKTPVEPPVQEPPVEEPPMPTSPVEEPPAPAAPEQEPPAEEEIAAAEMSSEGDPQLPAVETEPEPPASPAPPAEEEIAAAEMNAEGDPQLPAVEAEPAPSESPAPPAEEEIAAAEMNAEGDPQLPAVETEPAPAESTEPPTEEAIAAADMNAEGDPQLPPPDPDPLPPAPPEPLPPAPEPEPPMPDPSPEPVPGPPPLVPEPVMEEAEPVISAAVVARPETAPLISAPEPVPGLWPATPAGSSPLYWLLSLFTPSAGDTVDWARGNYTVMARGGRVDSPAGSGELKKQVQMIAEGSVLHSAGVPCGAAADVAPEGFAHPVFRAGFALSIPLPGREGSSS